MANPFFGFSPEAFEQFVRALAMSVLGPGVSAFGNGPDGGREAVFRGEVPYPYPSATQWSGYGVIQAKCKEKPESTDTDQKWALKQLNCELETFVQSDKRDPKPEYYVFVTNVELSSAAGGGRDQSDRLVRSYYGKLPLKGHAVWDANQLTAFLATYENLRKRFKEFLTPGDVLSAMLADIERRKPNVTRILSAFLERELRADEAARLDQAGNRTEEQLRLARLFFDLPAATGVQLDPPEEEPGPDGRLPHGVLWELLRDGSRKLDPKTVYEQETSSPKGKSERFPTRYVLLGGPGSGKSTLGQFLAQIHRTALLARRGPHLLEPQTRRIIQETRDLSDRDDLPWPTTPRYPFRIELNRFAKALASKEADHVESFGRYLLNEIKHENPMTDADLLDWLVAYPWLLILDGLDEVPATTNRDAVVKAVNDFLAEARQTEADLFVVATSREQGYSGEFASETVAFRHILPLSTVRALRYVERYADARFGVTNPNWAREIVDKLRESAKRQLTAQLMTSPLQVTFMATVVAARGDPGEDRWQLFDSYYRTIYDREQQKAVPPYNVVLSKQRPTVDRLHHDVGFLLQYRGETAEGTAVSLPIAQFERLVDLYLHDIGREGAEKEQMVKLITDAARHRLVFLTSRVAGELSFDVRSLQEYMAAECLMTGSPEIVKDRLRAIAPVPYWRNVFLFAASKCFADAQSRHLQDGIRLLCEDFNNPNTPLLDATKVGSELALDILQSGAVAENPNHARHLARIGLALLSQPYLVGTFREGASADQRLAVIYRDVLEAVYRRELELYIGQADTTRTLGAWPLLIQLIGKDISWAAELAESHWPHGEAQLPLFQRVVPAVGDVSWLRNKLREFVPTVSPSRIADVLRSDRVRDASDFLDALSCLIGLHSQFFTIPLKTSQQDTSGCEIGIVSIHPDTREMRSFYQKVAGMPRSHPDWLPLILANKFLSTPDQETLAKVLDECADGGWKPSGKTYPFPLPWPLADCLHIIQSPEDLRRLAQQVEKGALGNTADWAALEKRWMTDGINLDNLVSRTEEPLTGDRLVGSFMPVGIPRCTMSIKEYPELFVKTLFAIAQQIRPGEFREAVVWFLCGMCSSTRNIIEYINPSEFRTLLERDLSQLWWFENFVGYPDKPELVTSWLEFFDWLGRSDALSSHYRREEDDTWPNTFQEAFIKGISQHEQPQVGLLRLLGRLASVGYAFTMIPSEMLNLDSFSEPRFKLAALLVRLTQPNLTPDEAKWLADKATELLHPLGEPGAGDLIFGTVEAHLDSVPTIEHFLLRLRERMPRDVELGVAKCERLLRKVLRKRASDLQVPGQVLKLELPAILPV